MLFSLRLSGSRLAVTQFAAQDLAGCAQRQRVDEIDELRNFVMGQSLSDGLFQFVDQGVGADQPRSQYDERLVDSLTPSERRDEVLAEDSAGSRGSRGCYLSLPCSSIITGSTGRSWIATSYRVWRCSPERDNACLATRSARSRVAVAGDAPVMLE